MRPTLLALIGLLAGNVVPAAVAGSASPTSGCPITFFRRDCPVPDAPRECAQLGRVRVPARAPAIPPTTGLGEGALRIVLDPATSRPTFDPSSGTATPEDEPGRAPESFIVIHRADGSKSVYVGDHFMEYTVIQLAPDGSKHVRCVPSAGEAQRLVSEKSVAAKSPDPTRSATKPSAAARRAR